MNLAREGIRLIKRDLNTAVRRLKYRSSKSMIYSAAIEYELSICIYDLNYVELRVRKLEDIELMYKEKFKLEKKKIRTQNTRVSGTYGK
jgi:hypothetical protein